MVRSTSGAQRTETEAPARSTSYSAATIEGKKIPLLLLIVVDWVAISERLDKVPNCPVLPSGSAAGHFVHVHVHVPTSIVFGQFVQKLNSFLGYAPGLSAVTSAGVFKTPYCGLQT